MRKLIAWVFIYSLDGLIADEGAESRQFCFGLPNDPAVMKQELGRQRATYVMFMINSHRSSWASHATAAGR